MDACRGRKNAPSSSLDIMSPEANRLANNIREALPMAAQYDLVIRNGHVADGTGGPLFDADVAILDGKVAAIGNVSGSGREEINAKGKVVTPGFVDIHTHYDGQATWDARLNPSSWHGVTTIVMGNCGVG